jgi:8-oxo-dGTP pyrophosphatase MutT (NUDIX family)
MQGFSLTRSGVIMKMRTAKVQPFKEGALINESEIKDKLKQALTQRPIKTIKDDRRRASAVLVPIFFLDGECYILFTRRTELVHHHKGDISFPGGGFHAEDSSLLATALRESQEEIGLDPQDVEVLGRLDEIITRGSPYVISPFVGVFKPDYHYVTSVFEIAEIITIPVTALLQKSCREEGPEIDSYGQLVTAYVYAYSKCRITGATARILKQFLDIFASAQCL